jgi:EAL domain-containing protein (putative c-di-GMP-specific phosphodiesterase class I)/GAF domain-containing protein
VHRIRNTLENEEARLNALRDLGLLDTSPSETFDRLTRLASQLLSAPVSTVSLTDRDRQWFKSKVGVDITEIPREQAPCSYAIEGEGVFVVPDLMADPRFIGSPLASAGIRFYAGAPLVTRSGHGLGTICVVDDKPRQLAEGEDRVLLDLAGLVMSQIDLQNTIGRVDAISGFPNQHQLFEDLDDLSRQRAGDHHVLALVEFLPPSEVVHALSVLGTNHSDALIRTAIRILRDQLGPGFKLYHVGQMRCVVIPNDGWATSCDPLDRRILSVLNKPVFCEGVPVSLNPAVGCYSFTAGEVEPKVILRCLLSTVDDARNSPESRADFDPARAASKARMFTLLSDFGAALASDTQLRLVFQPRIDMETHEISGVEALLRWEHPILGSVPPGEFIPLIERTALIRPMTDWVVAQAIEQAVEWRATGRDLRVSINASALNLDEADFADRLLSAIAEAGLKCDIIELEFTESAVARDQDRVVSQLTRLSDQGVAIAIDDFGTGYSNLAYLQRLPVSVLKIDRAFVSKLASSPADTTLVRTIITMAHDLGYRVVAEGIEDQATYDLLVSWGCDEGQGYHLGRPMSVNDLNEYVLRHQHEAA